MFFNRIDEKGLFIIITINTVGFISVGGGLGSNHGLAKKLKKKETRLAITNWLYRIRSSKNALHPIRLILQLREP